MVLDEFPHVFKVDEEKIKTKVSFFGNDLVATGIGIVAEKDLLVSRIDVMNEWEVESSFRLLEQGFVVSVDVHQIPKILYHYHHDIVKKISIAVLEEVVVVVVVDEELLGSLLQVPSAFWGSMTSNCWE